MSDDIQKKPKENILYIQGMHCSSCEILIEKKLLKKDQVVAADVSLSDESAKVYIERGNFVDIDQLNKEFENDGYVFSKKPFPTIKQPFMNYDGKKLVINRDKLKQYSKTLIVFASFLFVFYFFEKMQLGKYVSVDASSSLPAFFLLGLVAGLSSCAALIGGILLSMIKHWNELYLGEDDQSARKTPHLLFHFGRLGAFFLLGGLLGLLGDLVSLNNASVYSLLVMIISVIMFVLALQMLNVQWAQRIRIRLPKFITRLAANDQTMSSKYIPFATGVLTFFLPCGFTLIAQGVALTTGDFFAGAMIMFAFALGTLPILLGISYTGLTFTKRPHLTAKFTQIAGLIIIFFALYNVNGQLNVLGLPSLSDLKLPEKPESKQAQVVLDPSGVQQVDLIAKGFEYLPANGTKFQAGVPTALMVDNQGVLGCGAFIAARGLFKDFIALDPGVNTIDLGSPKPGSYKITCSMGMVPPVTVTFN